MTLDWRAYIQDHFLISTKTGSVVPFIFNDVQNEFYDRLISKYGPSLEGVRENVVKGRQQGFSSVIDGLKTAKFLATLMETGQMFNAQIISHKAEETKPLFKRINLFIDSWLNKKKTKGITRKTLFTIDNKTSYFEMYNGSSLFVGTAGAKTLGRGGTLQAIHWSECAFYPDTEQMVASQLITGAEQQVMDGTGMIFRESTGNMVDDFMYVEFFKGLENRGSFGSNFYEWWKTKEYVKSVPDGYDFDNARVLGEVGYTYDLLQEMGLSDEQIYWWIGKLEDAKTPKEGLREYPNTVYDAFLASGDYFFNSLALKEHKSRVKGVSPIGEGLIYV